jgi:hypothetical protein
MCRTTLRVSTGHIGLACTSGRKPLQNLPMNSIFRLVARSPACNIPAAREMRNEHNEHEGWVCA